jgi:3-methyladenine DNA glycosylase AlkD
MTVNDLISTFNKHRNQQVASPMEAYLRNKFPFFGIKKTPRSYLQKTFIEFNKPKPLEELEELVVNLFNNAERELHYVGIELLVKAKIYKNKKSIKLFERLLISNSWWDSVDTIAVKLVGAYFAEYPEEREKWIRKWIKSDNIWLNRTAIIFQLSYKNQLDIPFLVRAILPHTNSKEFFIQKAIGWALRQYAKTNPKWVKDFVKSNTLKPLSKREALKYL